MKKLFYLLLFIIPCGFLYGQNQSNQVAEPLFGIKFSGFVKNDFFYDTRQTVTAREGHFLLWPAAEKLDQNGTDINAAPSFNFLSIQSRLTGAISGPDAFGAKTSGMMEGAFFGNIEPNINSFRLRHAFVKLNWTNTELLFGQTWNPLFNTVCFPDVISFNTGAPFQPFARNPQIRLTQSIGHFKFMAAALSQVDFTSAGGSSLIRNSGSPEIQGQISYTYKSENGTEINTGIGGGYKTLRPRLETSKNGANYIEDERVGSFSSQAFLKIKTNPLTFKLQGFYGQNAYDVTGISSFAVNSLDTANDYRTYTPLTSYSVWSELHTNGKTVMVGIFGGYTGNLGAGETILPQYTFGNRSNIDYVWRVSPRIVWNYGKMRLAAELEYTTAAFGKIDNQGEITNAKEVSNLRTLFAVYYFF